MSEHRRRTPASAPDAASPGAARTRGTGAFVGMTLRLARAEGVSVNALALRGLSRLFVERGLPPL